MECLVVCFLRMDCRVTGINCRIGFEGEQARPYGGERNGYDGKFLRRYERLSTQHTISVSGEGHVGAGGLV